jgi:hypothetical protein
VQVRRRLGAGLIISVVLGILGLVGASPAHADGVFAFGPSSLPDAPARVAYTQALTATSPDAVPPITWTLDSGTLPYGLALSSDGVLSGTPIGDDRFDFVLRVTDANGLTDTHQYFLGVWEPPQMYTHSLPNGVVGTVYPKAYASARSKRPLTWAVTVGSLPDGLALDPSGAISGVPTTAGTSTFEVTVTDDFGRTASSTLSIRILDPLVISSVAVSDAAQGRDYRGFVYAAGGMAPYFWYLDGGALPPGLTLRNGQDDQFKPTGLISGTPTTAGTFTATVQAKDNAGRIAEQDVTITVAPPRTPDAPDSVYADRAHRTVTVSWLAPDYDGGSPITGYEVTPYVGDAPRPSTICPASPGHCDFTLLIPGAAYTFTVAAVNALGTGASIRTNAVTPAQIPGPVSGVAVVAGDKEATVSWSDTAWNGGSPLLGAVVRDYSPGGYEWKSVQVAAGVTSTVVPGLINGVTHTVTVTVYNAEGLGIETAPLSVTPAARPDLPPTIGAAAPGNGSATLVWTRPANTGGQTITGYVVTAYADDVAQAARVLDSPSTSQVLSGLTNGATYTFRVAARYGADTGPQSSPSAPIKVGAPSAPGFQSAQPGNASARVSWAAPTDNGSPVTGYVITPYIGWGPGKSGQVVGPGTSFVWTGLTNGTAYTFKVAAINARGVGPESTTNEVTVGAPTAPAFPRAVPGTTSARLAWSAPAANGAPIQGYRVTPYVGAVAQPTIDFHSTATTETVTGLVSGTTYTFKAVAYNALGSSPVATWPAVTVGTPAQPAFQSATPGDGSAVMHFMSSVANSAPLTSYTIWPVRNGVLLPAQVFATPSATQLTVAGLVNGATYTFRVAATNAVGMGPYATTNAVVVGTPTAPGFISAQPGDGSARVSWLASAGNGSPVTSYVVTPYVGTVAQPSQIFAPGTAAVVTGLTNGTTYTFKASAVNAVGPSLPATTPVAVKAGTPTTPGWPAVRAGDRSVVIAVQASAANGSPVTSYVVTPMVGTTALAPQTFAGNTTRWTVTGLTNGVTYTFRIVAVNAVGAGPPGTTAAVKVGPAT